MVSLCQIASEIAVFCRRWGRIAVSDSKSKFGTVRVYCSFGWCMVHDKAW